MRFVFNFSVLLNERGNSTLACTEQGGKILGGIILILREDNHCRLFGACGVRE